MTKSKKKKLIQKQQEELKKAIDEDNVKIFLSENQVEIPSIKVERAKERQEAIAEAIDLHKSSKKQKKRKSLEDVVLEGKIILAGSPSQKEIAEMRKDAEEELHKSSETKIEEITPFKEEGTIPVKKELRRVILPPESELFEPKNKEVVEKTPIEMIEEQKVVKNVNSIKSPRPEECIICFADKNIDSLIESLVKLQLNVEFINLEI